MILAETSVDFVMIDRTDPDDPTITLRRGMDPALVRRYVREELTPAERAALCASSRATIGRQPAPRESTRLLRVAALVLAGAGALSLVSAPASLWI